MIEPALPLEIVVLQQCAAGTADALRNRRIQPFDLRRGPVWRAAILTDGSRAVGIELTLHHLITDGLSAAILLSDIASGLTNAAELESLPRGDYAEYVSELLFPPTERAEAFWTEQFRNRVRQIKALTGGGAQQDRQEAGFLEIRLDPDLVDAVSARSASAGATLFMGCFAAWSMTLCRWLSERNLVIAIFWSLRPEQYRSTLGCFSNTLPIRIEVASDSFDRCLQAARSAIIAALEHATVPVHRIMQLSGHGPFVLQTAFSFDPALPTIEGDLRLEGEIVPGTVPKFALSASLIPTENGMRAQFEYDRAALSDAEMARISRLFLDVLRQFGNGAREVNWQAGLAREELPSSRHHSATAVPAAKLDALVALVAARRREAVAVRSDISEMTYGELLSRSRRIAGLLRARGAGPGSIVGFALPRGAPTIAIMLGILMSGAAFLPLDPANPDMRLAQMIEDARPILVITERALTGRFSKFINTIEISGLDGAMAALPESSAALEADGAALAYVIFTSGTTGRPKGVAIEHRSIVDHVIHGAPELGMSAHDCTLQFCSLSWDASIEEIFFALCTGGTIAIRNEAMLESPSQFFAGCRRLQVTVLNLPTAFFHYLADDVGTVSKGELSALRVVTFSGERADPAAVRRWRVALPASCRLINSYGPTEATITVSFHDCAIDDDPVPVGGPRPNVGLFVADSELRLLPHGAIGELCIAGTCLARGYIGRDDLTQTAFPTVHWGRELQIYRTGDVAKILPNGECVVYGRSDHQVKLRGVRVELSEVEQSFGAMPELSRCVACIERQGSAGESLILAAVPASGATLDPDALRSHAHSVLPYYMWPTRFIVVPELPVDINGKIDRAAILSLVLNEPAPSVKDESMTTLQARVATILGTLLGRERLGLDEDFIVAGGHSLMCARANAEFEREFAPGATLDVPERGHAKAPRGCD